MLPEDFTLGDSFPPVSYPTWQESVQREPGVTDIDPSFFDGPIHEGVRVRPIYTLADQLGDPVIGRPGEPPFVRGVQRDGNSGWDLRQEISAADPATANRLLLDSHSSGATSVWVRLDRAARDGMDLDSYVSAGAPHPDGVAAYHIDDFQCLLDQVPLESLLVALEAGAAFLPAAAMVVALWRRRKVSPDQACGAFQADPLAYLARHGTLPIPVADALEQLTTLVKWTNTHYPHVTSVGVDPGVYHQAGATAVQELALAVATGVEYLRALAATDLAIGDAARQLTFQLYVTSDPFYSIAKLRAARWMWSRILQACDRSGATVPMCIHARPSQRRAAQSGDDFQLLHNVVSMFAACLGQANSIGLVSRTGSTATDELHRRIARQTGLIVQHEAGLHAVIDPAGGSWWVDRVTQDLAESAWSVFQQIERQGGIAAALQSGWVAEQIANENTQCAETSQRESLPQETGDWSRAAADRLAKRRHAKWNDASMFSGTDPMESLIAAADAGATLGQLAHAVGFHRTGSRPARRPDGGSGDAFLREKAGERGERKP